MGKLYSLYNGVNKCHGFLIGKVARAQKEKNKK